VIRILRLIGMKSSDGFVIGDPVRVRGIEGVGFIYSVDDKNEHAVVSYGPHREIAAFWRISRALRPSKHDRSRDG
jgi:hypothetical protein